MEDDERGKGEPSAKRPKLDEEGGAPAASAHNFAPPPAQAQQKPEKAFVPFSFAPKILRFDGVSPDTDRNAIASLCKQHGEVAFVDFRFGETTGYVRFRKPEGAKAAQEALTGSEVSGGAVPSWPRCPRPHA